MNKKKIVFKFQKKVMILLEIIGTKTCCIDAIKMQIKMLHIIEKVEKRMKFFMIFFIY